MKRHLLLILLTVVTGGHLLAQTEYVSNLIAPSDNGVFVRDDMWITRAFSTGGNATGYALDSLWLDLRFASDSTFTVQLWSDGSGAPGGSLMDFTRADGMQFDPVSGITLAAATTYWVVATSTEPFNGSFSYVWNLSHDSAASLVDGWTLGAGLTSGNQGDSWVTSHRYKLAVTATAMAAVPEPSTYAATAGVAALGFVAWRRRRRVEARRIRAGLDRRASEDSRACILPNWRRRVSCYVTCRTKSATR